MFRVLRALRLAILALFATTAVHAQAPSPEPVPAQAKKKAVQPGTPAAKLNLDEPLATVDDEVITRGDLLKSIKSLQIPPGYEQKLYDEAIKALIDRKLLPKLVERFGVKITEAEIEDSFSQFDKQIRLQSNQKATIDSYLAENKMTKAELRAQAVQRLQVEKYFENPAVEKEIKAYYERNRDIYDQNRIVVSHILLKVPPQATAEEKAKVRGRIDAIKKEIDLGRISFADAANKYSQDEGNEDKVGGSLGTIPRRGKFKYEKFVAAAFALKKGSVSEPVETELGFHLIQVTDKIPGRPFDFEQNKNTLRMEFFKDAMLEERKKHKIDIKPMPPDLFPAATKESAQGSPRSPGGGLK